MASGRTMFSLGGQSGQQVVLLEDEADPLAPQRRQLLVAEPAQRHPPDLDVAAVDLVEAGEAVHQRRLAGPGRAHDGGVLPARDVHADAGKSEHGGVSSLP